MNDEAYRKRLSADLDKWIAGGLVSAEQRSPILATLPPANERPAASILAWAGAVLAGLAVIAFMAANWDFIPRFFRLLVILGVFWGALYGALWCEKNGKPKSRQASLLFAVLVFASGLGLVGQMYNLAGDPSDVLLAAGLAGLLLGAAGRSGPATATGLLFSGAWYTGNAFDNHAAIGMEDLIAALIPIFPFSPATTIAAVFDRFHSSYCSSNDDSSSALNNLRAILKSVVSSSRA